MTTTRRAHRVGMALAVACVMGIVLVVLGASGALAQKEARTQKPTDRVKALVLGEAASPVLTELKRNQGWQLTQAANAHGRGNDPDKYDALVVDGDSLSPQQLGNGTLVDEFADAHRWVLALDTSRADYQQGLIDHTGFTVVERRGTSHMFLFSRQMLNNSPRVLMFEAESLQPLGSENLEQEELLRRTALQTREVASSATQAVSADRATLTREYSPLGDTGVPDEAQHEGYTYTPMPNTAVPPDGFFNWTDWSPDHLDFRAVHVPAHGHQTLNWTVNHHFDVYLDNYQHAEGNFQYVTYELSGEFTPKKPGEKFFQMDDVFKLDLSAHDFYMERAWWTGMWRIAVEPDSATDSKIHWEASEPQTPNQENEYRSGQDFEVGFSPSLLDPKVDFKFPVSDVKNYRVPDWGVENESAGNSLNWLFSARNACDVRPLHYNSNNCFDNRILQDGMPLRPNDLSLSQLQAHTSGRWKTRELLKGTDGIANFSVKTPVTVIDTYCRQLLLGGCVDREINRHSVIKDENYQIDIGVVNPIPVESLTLAPNPANGTRNDKVTGTVTLERPAAKDVRVVIYSNSENAVVGIPITDQVSKVTVPIAKGKTSGTFQVLTNDNKLSPGQHTTATITAFYTTPTPKQLTVVAQKKK